MSRNDSNQLLFRDPLVCLCRSIGRVVLLVGVSAGLLAAGLAGPAQALPSSAAVPAARPTWVQVSAGAGFSCGIGLDGSLWCWGQNEDGQLGDGSTQNSDVPVRVGTGTGWVQVSAGDGHACGLDSGGSAWCWGDNTYGELGDGGSGGDSDVPVQVVGSDWAQLSVGRGYSCGLQQGGTVWCWGVNDRGQLGDGGTAASSVPVQVGGLSGWSGLSVGYGSGCALRPDASAWCWGWNQSGELGVGPLRHRNFVTSPTEVVGGYAWSSVSVGAGDACGVQADGSLWCWGHRLGYHGHHHTSAPQRVSEEAGWASVSVGGRFACALEAVGSLWCWGNETEGDLGIGNKGRQRAPALVGHSTSWASVSAAFAYTTLATKLSGTGWAWGNNSDGELGDGGTTDQWRPVRVR